MKRFFKIVSAFALLFTGCFAVIPSMDKSVDIQQLIDSYIKNTPAVGVAVAYVDHGNIKFFFSGKSSIDQDKLITNESVFEIGSITKVFTTLALMEQIREGKILLDDPIEKYLPGIKIPEKNGNKITVKQLATHTSGLPCVPTNLYPEDEQAPYDDYDLVKLYEFLGEYELEKEPGAEYEYSNLGMALLGHVLAKADQKSYEEMMQARVFDRIFLRNTYLSYKDVDPSKMAQGHHLYEKVKNWNLSIISPAGSICSNIDDMVIFLAANMGLINSIMCDLLHGCHAKQVDIPKNSFGLIGVGLGWHINYSEEGDIIWHNGGTGGYESFIGFNPDTQKGIVILSNSTEDFPTDLGLHILNQNFYKLNPTCSTASFSSPSS